MIRLVVADTLTIDGLLDAGGNDAGLASHTGGAGGSVFLTAGVVTGIGTISANGGGTLGAGGGAGGGRIAITAASLEHAGSLTAIGGNGGQRGGAGTISPAPARRQRGLAGRRPHGSARRRANRGRRAGVSRCNPRRIDEPGGDGGHADHVRWRRVGRRHWLPSRAGPGASTLDGGGGHGGRGGRGVLDPDGGATYGSRFFPIHAGSGGGGQTGGAGGGLIHLTVEGTLTVNGSLTANGGNAGLATHGAGAGGGIRLTVSGLAGTGTIAASGGASVNAGGAAAAALRSTREIASRTSTSGIRVFVDGGSGAHSGAPGTVFFGYDNLMVAGLEDAFAFPSEPNYQSADLHAALAGLALASFDVAPAGGAVAATFPAVSPLIASGLVALRIRAGAAPASETDRLVLGFAGASGLDEAWSRYLGSTNGTADPGLLGLPWTSGLDTTLVLDLNALPLADGGVLDLTGEIAAHGFLDIVASHHTAVDFVLLTYCTITGDPISVSDADHANPAEVVTSLVTAPNPFNPRTVIRFALARPVVVSLAVYDLRGRRVAHLVQGSLPAGDHQVEFTANDLPSGTYFTRLVAGQSTVTNKVMLLR